MTLLHTKRFSSWIRGHLVCRIEGVGDRFALTFDDGPNGRMTPRLLDLLEARGARATFFMLAGNVRRHPDIVRRVVDGGHEAAAHGEMHWPMPLLPPWLLAREVRRSAAAIARVTGVLPRHYRPAFGFMAPGQSAFVRHLGLVSVLGDVYPEDPQQPGVGKIVARTMARLAGGSILILHDGSPMGDTNREQTLAATAVILERAASRGLRAVTVQELMDVTAAA